MIPQKKPYDCFRNTTICPWPEASVSFLTYFANLGLHIRFRYPDRDFSTDDTFAAWPKGSCKPDEIRAFLKAVPGLETLNLTASSSSFSRAETPEKEFPGIRVLHTISICEHSVKTSATAFSTPGGGDSPRNDEKYFECLHFCPDLPALDPGRQKIRSVDFLRFFPELKVLILADNKPDSDDLAKLAEYWPHLEYLELFMNDIAGLSPLAGLAELKYLNIAHNRIADAAAHANAMAGSLAIHFRRNSGHDPPP